jgi:hypothetical protein
MFFNTKRLERLEREIVMLEELYKDTLMRLSKLEESQWGLRIDGTPKAKPGRKVKDERIS